MYKKLYREALEEIPVNTALMERLKAEAAKEPKRRSRSLQYRYGYAAAALLLAVVSAGVLPRLRGKPIATEPVPAVFESADITAGDEAVEAKTRTKESGNNKPAEIRTEEDAAPNVARAMLEEADGSEVLMYDKYIEDFGFSYSEEGLPEGMVMTDGMHFSSEANPDNTHCVTYQGDGKMMSVTFYPDGEAVREMINSISNGPKRESDQCFFEEKAENEYKVYVIKGKKGYLIEAMGVEKEELNRFTESIGK